MGLPLLKYRLALLLAAGCFCTARGAELQALVSDLNGKPLSDAVVVATALDPKAAQHAPLPTDSIDQLDKQFVPYVKPVLVGSTVRFPNNDNIRHQVYSFSPAKTFELPLYAGTQAAPVLFDRPGVVVLGCNIHDWMIGYIYVSESPFFAKSAADGQARIADLPPGDYQVRVWHPGLQGAEAATAKRITVGADQAAKEQWRLGVKLPPRVPRVSGAGSPTYP